jgi:TIR domain
MVTSGDTASPQPRNGVFLSYRRSDSSGWCGRLHEHLAEEWGADRVFMDIDAIAPGEDFRVAIERTIATCAAVVVVIGPTWLTATDQRGVRRLDDEGDSHRNEIAAALASGVRVVPVLVGGTPMPTVADLPAALRELAFRNAAVIEDRRFASDARLLQDSLHDVVGPPRPATRGFAGGTSAGAPGGTGAPRPDPTGEPPAAPARRAVDPATVLAVAGTVVVVVWGVFAERGWHNERSGVRIVMCLLLVALTVAGLVTSRPPLVLAGGAAGSIGYLLWVVQLVVDGHSVSELFSFAEDGLANTLTLAGALTVLGSGWWMTDRSEPRARTA